MLMIGLSDEDINLNQYGQPADSGDGDVLTVSGDQCWMQDLKNEVLTEEGELFYEDEEGIDAYGFGMLDFLQAEDDQEEFLKLEIRQRVQSKLQKRSYIDGSSIEIDVTSVSRERVEVTARFKRYDEETVYKLSIDVSDGDVEVSLEGD